MNRKYAVRGKNGRFVKKTATDPKVEKGSVPVTDAVPEKKIVAFDPKGRDLRAEYVKRYGELPTSLGEFVMSLFDGLLACATPYIVVDGQKIEADFDTKAKELICTENKVLFNEVLRLRAECMKKDEEIAEKKSMIDEALASCKTIAQDAGRRLDGYRRSRLRVMLIVLASLAANAILIGKLANLF